MRQTAKTQTATVDDKYYEVARPNSIAEKVMIKARHAMFETFLRFHSANADDKIIDIGVSDVITGGDNMLERQHPFPSTITAVGLGEGHEFRKAFPATRYLQIESERPLPFPDRHFNLAVSNAVLEHVGSREAQTRFVEEMVRVSEQAFLTVPNRYFFVEHNTSFPFIHWTDWSFSHACCILGKEKWGQESALMLMSYKRLKEISLELGEKFECAIGYTGIYAGPCSSNLYMNIRRRKSGLNA